MILLLILNNRRTQTEKYKREWKRESEKEEYNEREHERMTMAMGCN